MKKLYKLGAIMTAILMVGFMALSVNAQSEQVQVEITGGDNNCTFNSYTMMSTGFSYTQQTLETANTPAYTCTMNEGDVSANVTIQSASLENPNVTPNIPAANVKAKHVTSSNVTAGSCTLSNELASTYTNVSSAVDLFAKDDYTVCTVEGTTQIEVTVPVSLPVGTYTGNITFVVN